MIQVIERFHRILEAVAFNNAKSMKLKEMAVMLDISNPACSNILRTMVQLGYLRRSKRGEYALGATMERFAAKGKLISHLVEIARPMITQLAVDLGEMIVLVNDNYGHRNELIKLQGENQIQLNPTRVSEIDNLLYSVTGMILLAWRSLESRQMYWQNNPHINNSLDAKNAVELEIACKKIRQRGYYSSGNVVEECKVFPPEGGITIAFPVLLDDIAIAALGLEIPAYRFTREFRDSIIKKCNWAILDILELLKK